MTKLKNPFPWTVEGDESGSLICDANGVQFAWFADIEVANHMVECAQQSEMFSHLTATTASAIDFFNAAQAFVSSPSFQQLSQAIDELSEAIDAITAGGDES